MNKRLLRRKCQAGRKIEPQVAVEDVVDISPEVGDAFKVGGTSMMTGGTHVQEAIIQTTEEEITAKEEAMGDEEGENTIASLGRFLLQSFP